MNPQSPRLHRTAQHRQGASLLTATLLAATLLTSVAGCSFHARGPAQFQKDTRALLERREPQIRACYEALLKKDEKAAGTIVVTFTIKKKTGEFTDWQFSGNTPDRLKKCMAESLQGLKLEPVDERDGRGEFAYEFRRAD